MLPSQTAHGACDYADLRFLVVGHILHHKYYSDKGGTKEIKQADTVTAKLSGGTVKPGADKSPQTGDNSNLLLWIALLFISGGAVTVTTVYGRKKKRLTK